MQAAALTRGACALACPVHEHSPAALPPAPPEVSLRAIPWTSSAVPASHPAWAPRRHPCKDRSLAWGLREREREGGRAWGGRQVVAEGDIYCTYQVSSRMPRDTGHQCTNIERRERETRSYVHQQGA